MNITKFNLLLGHLGLDVDYTSFSYVLLRMIELCPKSATLIQVNTLHIMMCIVSTIYISI